MENRQGSSFIPKNTVRTTTKPQNVRRVYIFTYVAFVLFFGTAIATVGIFIYDISIDNQIAAQQENLSKEREVFNQADLERVRELDARMNKAFGILDQHVAVHSIMDVLDAAILKSVQVTAFEYVKDIDNSLNLTLTLQTKKFNDSLAQRESFLDHTLMENPVISEVTFSESLPENTLINAPEGKVTFMLSKELKTSDIPYIARDSITESSIGSSNSNVPVVSEEASFLEELNNSAVINE